MKQHTQTKRNKVGRGKRESKNDMAESLYSQNALANKLKISNKLKRNLHRKIQIIIDILPTTEKTMHMIKTKQKIIHLLG